MSYQNFYSNLPGVRSSFRDGILNALTPTNSPNIIVIDTADKGPSYNVFGDDGTSALVSQFGSSNLVYNLSQIKDSIAGSGSVGVIKVGGTQGHILLTKDISGSYEKDEIVRISCLRTEKDYLSKVKLILLPFESTGIVRQRVLIIDENNIFVYDSEFLLTQNVNDFEVAINNDFGINNIMYTPQVYASTNLGGVTCQNLLDISSFDFTLISALPSVASLVKADIYLFLNNTKTGGGNALGAAPASLTHALTKIAPVSGSGESSYNKLYAAGEMVCEKLHQFTSSIFVAPSWHANVMASNINAIDPTKQEAYFYDNKALGHVFKVMYQGKPYVFMFGRKTAIAAANLKAVDDFYDHQVKIGGTDVWLQFILKSEAQRELGDLLNLVEFHFHGGVPNSNTCKEWFFNYKGKIECHIDLTLAFNVALPADVTIATPFCDLKLKSGSVLTTVATSPAKLRLSKVNGSYSLSQQISANEDDVISDPFIQTPYDLTGAYVPEEVMQKLLTLSDSVLNAAIPVASNTQIREVNLAHQAAQLAYKASSVYNATIAVVGLASAQRLGIQDVSTWAGVPPTFEIDANQTVRVKTNGKGVFSNKFLYGSTTYRNKSAYGGFILTTGSQLPDAEPYGIDDTDEALDAGGYPIDLGRNLVIVGSSANVDVNMQGNQQTSVGISANNSSILDVKNLSLAAKVAAKIYLSPENREPIGPYNGLISGVRSVTSFTPAMLNTFAIGRICMLDPLTNSISALRTAALPTSDFTRLSTIRVANRLLRNIRQIGLKYIGNTFGPSLQSLQSEIDGYLVSEIRLGMVQGNPSPSADVYASKLDQIAGKVNVRLRFTPPFALESIQVDMAVQPPAGN